MHFTQLQLKNFYSYGDVTVDLDDQGLVLIKGQNDDSAVMESNGAGKSTLVVDSILWTLFGKTPRGQNSADIVRRNSNKEGCFVKIGWLDDSVTYQVIRYQDHPTQANKLIFCCSGIRDGESYLTDLSQSDKRETQKLIEEKLGFTYDIALNAMVLGQKSISFAGMTDSAKKDVLEKVLDFDKLAAAQLRAATLKKSWESKLETAQGLVRASNNSLAALTTRKDNLVKSSNEWESRINAEIDKQRGELTGVISSIEKKEKTILGYQEGVKGLKAQSETDRLEIDRVRREHLTLYDQMQIATGNSKRSEARLEEARQKRVVEICPTCKEPIPIGRVEDARANIEMEVRDLTEESEELMKIAEDRTRVWQSKVEEIKLFEAKPDVSAQVRELDSLLMANNSELGTLRGRKLFLEQSLNSPKENPFTVAIQQVDLDIGTSQKNLSQAQTDCTSHEKAIKLYNFWNVAFGKKGLQSYLLDSVVPYLNERLNKYASLLLGGEIFVEFRTQRLLSDGKTLKDELNVHCENKFGGATVEGQSGGETDRVDICVAMALQDLVINRQGKDFNFCVFDEVVKYIDGLGVTLYFDFLREVSRDRKTMFVITHSPHLESLFTNIWTVVKKDGRSSLILS